jgi:hypothetical protein
MVLLHLKRPELPAVAFLYIFYHFETYQSVNRLSIRTEK